MKIFWSLMALLVAGLTVTFLIPGSDRSTSATPAAGRTGDRAADEPNSPAFGARAEPARPDPSPAAGSQAGSEPGPEPSPDPITAPTPDPQAAPAAETPISATMADASAADSVNRSTTGSDNSAVIDLAVEESASAKLAETPTGLAPATQAAAADTVDTQTDTAAVGITWDDILGAIAEDAPAAPAPLADADDATGSAPDDGAEVATADGTGSGRVAEASALDLRQLPDGTTLVNDRFTLAGDGSKDRPYEITWDYLTSARETYLPRDGKTEIPPHVAMLDGKYVRLGGYLQFPLATPEPKELLVMLNQWDGCCIGVPPTPYDAVEVSLTTPATRGEKFAVEGSLVGRLKIDPYLVGDWLIGLYLIGDATLDVSGSRSAEEVYGNSPTVGDPNAMPGG